MTRLVLALLLLVAAVGPHAARAADAGYCIAQCNARCYKDTTPSCAASCTNRCMFSGPGNRPSGPAVYWGAVAAGHPPDGSVGYGIHYGNAAAARSRAMAECRKIDTGKCDLLLSFSSPFCFAAVTAWNGNDSQGTFANTAQNRSLAEQQALAQCRRDQPAANCELISSACASD